MFLDIKYRRQMVIVLLGLTLMVVPQYLFSKDEFLTFRSTKDVLLDELRGTAILEGNVFVKQESTGSTLVTDKLFIQRDSLTKKPILAKAQGNVHMVIHSFNKSNSKVRTIDVVCKYAEVDRTENKALLNGLVTIKSHDFELTADSVFYDIEKEFGIVTEIPGKQVQFKAYKNSLPVDGQTKAQKQVLKIIEGTSNEIRMDRPLRKTTLQGKVVIIDHSEQARFTAQRADIFFDHNEQLDRVVAYQNVQITQPKRKSSADRAAFDYKNDTIVLTGNASVKDVDQLEINSSTITMHMDQNKRVIGGDSHIPLKGKAKIP